MLISCKGGVPKIGEPPLRQISHPPPSSPPSRRFLVSCWLKFLPTPHARACVRVGMRHNAILAYRRCTGLIFATRDYRGDALPPPNFASCAKETGSAKTPCPVRGADDVRRLSRCNKKNSLNIKLTSILAGDNDRFGAGFFLAPRR